jgi:hypothetical protein
MRRFMLTARPRPMPRAAHARIDRRSFTSASPPTRRHRVHRVTALLLVVALAASACANPAYEAGELLADAQVSHDEGRLSEALTAFDAIIDEYGDSTNPEVLAVVAQALAGKSSALMYQGQSEEAIGVSLEIVARFGDGTNQSTDVAVAFGHRSSTIGTSTR